MVDTRTEKEYRAKRIRGAVWAAYGEKSLKDVAFDPATDDFSALDKLPAKGAILIAAPLKIKHGTGSPIRALALVPRG